MFSKNQPQKPTPQTRTPEMPRRSTAARAQASAPSILSRDLVVTGEITTEGDVQIEGRLEGNVQATTLTVGEQGVVNGTIKAGVVLIRGKVTGKINAGTVELAETANVLADIIQDHLTIANGAFFDGKCTRRTKPTSGAAGGKKMPAPATAKKAS